jgi:hypothetical protein
MRLRGMNQKWMTQINRTCVPSGKRQRSLVQRVQLLGKLKK